MSGRAAVKHSISVSTATYGVLKVSESDEHFALCSCGFRGPTRARFATADRDAIRHTSRPKGGRS